LPLLFSTSSEVDFKLLLSNHQVLEIIEETLCKILLLLLEPLSSARISDSISMSANLMFLVPLRRLSSPKTIPSLWEELERRPRLKREFQLSLLLLIPPHLSTIRKNSRRDLEDSLVELPLSKLVEPPRLKSLSSRTELRMPYVLPELPLTKVSFQEVELLSSWLQEVLIKSREITSIKISELR